MWHISLGKENKYKDELYEKKLGDVADIFVTSF